MLRRRIRFKHTAQGIRPEPIGAYVHCMGFGLGRELLGEVIDTFPDPEDGSTRLRVKHFNGDPWPITPRISAVDVII